MIISIRTVGGGDTGINVTPGLSWLLAISRKNAALLRINYAPGNECYL
jgi:hypothetical protein